MAGCAERRCAFVLAMVLGLLVAGTAAAEAAEGKQEWEELNKRTVQTYQSGDYKGALDLAEKAYALARRTFGKRDERTLTSLNNLAGLYKAQGRYGEAEPLYKEALQASREVLGARHPNTLSSLNNLAMLYDSQGRYGEAEALFKEALQARREVLGPRHPNTLSSLNNLAMLYQAQGRYGEAEPLYKEALQARREVLGPRHPNTLISLNNLAALYESQGRYGEAEPLYKEALQARREMLGPRHPDTLISLNNLAELYESQGRYGEAEPPYKEALQAHREVLGARHPNTLTSLNNLAGLYKAQGRYGEAEPLYKEALQGRREVLGPRHPGTLRSLNNLAGLYWAQGRYGEAEPLFKEALQACREVLGARHPQTLTSLDNLAGLYWAQGRYGEAEPLYKEALQAHREVLGPRHPDTLTSLIGLAALYDSQGRYGEAEPLYSDALQASRDVLGARHPNTLTSLNNLAALYDSQGRYGEAEPLYREALQGYREVLGPRHPQTLTSQINMVVLLVNQGRREQATRTLQAMEPNLLDWIGQELYATEGGAVRRQLVSSQSDFQDVVLTLATADGSADARRLAGTLMLRFKGLQGEEEAYLARLARRSQDPRVQKLAAEVGDLRTRLAAAARGGTPEDFHRELQALEAKQLALGQVSSDYKDHLRVRTANLDDVRAALPVGSLLIEFRQFSPMDFRSGKLGEPRLAALLLAGFDEPMLADLGAVAGLTEPVAALLAPTAGTQGDRAAADLYRRLFAPFEAKLAAAKRVYLAADGVLHLVPFGRLRLADGHYWEERQEVRLLATGRDLLRPDPDRPAKGLLALGGIDFGATVVTASRAAQPEGVFLAAVKRTRESVGSFKALPASGEEASKVKDTYRLLRKNEPAEAWTGAAAGEARLKDLAPPPRVLHLATHGFYQAGEDEAAEPMLLSGVALAGANRTLAGEREDGVLFALEAQGLEPRGQ
ncbi:MAG: tetratricopeptide repeat protein [Defluviicoccus sp.]